MSESEPKKPRKNHRKEPNIHDDFFRAINTFIVGFVTEREDLTKQKNERTLIDSFIVKIKDVFKFIKPKEKELEKEDRKLAGRIQELNKNAADVLKVLNTVRKDLKSEVDDELYMFVESVMNPMIRDVEKVQKIATNNVSAHQKMDAFNKYNEWIDKAKLWVQVCSTAKNKDAITKAVIKHTVDDFNAMIERDLQLIEDYQQHLLYEIVMDDEQKLQIKDEIELGLKPYVKSLLGLKKPPKGVNLDNLNQWKDNADKRRDRYFNAILQLIDGKINEINPANDQKEEHGDLMGTLEQISYLEMEIPLLAEKFDQEGIDPFEIEVSIQQLLALEEEVDELYLDISMPQKIIDRLQHLRDSLVKISNKIKKQQ
jgi:hypothetical protein